MTLVCPVCEDHETTLNSYEKDGDRITGYMSCGFGHDFADTITVDKCPKYLDADLACDLGIQS